jgi:hypothetical protein
MTDAEILAAFEGCTLPREAWTHEMHVRVAWLYLRGTSFEAALPAIGQAIRTYNASKGVDPAAYNETVTHAFVHLIRHRRSATPETFEAFRARNPDLFDRVAPILLRHYAKETLASRAAHEAFVPPDRAPLP